MVVFGMIDIVRSMIWLIRLVMDSYMWPIQGAHYD